MHAPARHSRAPLQAPPLHEQPSVPAAQRSHVCSALHSKPLSQRAASSQGQPAVPAEHGVS